MARLKFVLACESLSVDQMTNAVSLFNIVEQYPANAVIPKVVVVSYWHLDAEELGQEFQATLRIRRGAADAQDVPMNFTGSARRQRTVHIIVGIPTPAAGQEIEFEVLLNGAVRGNYSISIVEANQPQAAPPAARADQR
jgi:hypothetical protein